MNILITCLLLTLLAIIIIFLTAQFFNILFRGYAPVISTKGKVIERISAEINPKEGEVFYELGCGYAALLRTLEKKGVKAKLIGIEYSWLIWLITNIQLSFRKSSIKIIKKNMFKVDLKDADYIYVYLNLKMNAELEKKIKAECKPGTTIISYQFKFTNLELVREIKEDNRRIFFYKI